MYKYTYAIFIISERYAGGIVKTNEVTGFLIIKESGQSVVYAEVECCNIVAVIPSNCLVLKNGEL